MSSLSSYILRDSELQRIRFPISQQARCPAPHSLHSTHLVKHIFLVSCPFFLLSPYTSTACSGLSPLDTCVLINNLVCLFFQIPLCSTKTSTRTDLGNLSEMLPLKRNHRLRRHCPLVGPSIHRRRPCFSSGTLSTRRPRPA